MTENTDGFPPFLMTFNGRFLSVLFDKKALRSLNGYFGAYSVTGSLRTSKKSTSVKLCKANCLKIL